MAAKGSNSSAPENPQNTKGFGHDILAEIVKKNPAEGIATKYHKEAPPVIENLFEDFYEASAEVDKRLLSLQNVGVDKAVLIRSTPGIGKTEAGLHLLSVLAKKGLMPFLATPTRNMAWQAYDRLKGGFFGYGHRVVMLEGRHNGYVRRRYEDDGSLTEISVEPNCHRFDQVCKAREKGYPAQHYVCAKCPFWPLYKDSNHGEKTGFHGACEYFRDLYRAARFVPYGSGDWAPIVITTHHMAACMMTNSEILKPEFLIIDEDMITALREIYIWDEYELARKIDGDALVIFRKFMAKSIEVAKKFQNLAKYPVWNGLVKSLPDDEKELHKILSKSQDYGTTTLFGKGLVKVFEKSAKDLGYKLESVVNNAALAMTGVEKGEFSDMPDWRFKRLPHYKEPELAEEIQNIINDANNGEESAYKVSFRKMPDEPWGFYWDHVQRMSYGGPLLMLDAYGDKTLYERVCGREVQVEEIKCRIRKNVTVNHYPIRTSRVVMDENELRRALFFEYVTPILRKYKGKKVLLYTQKRYADWLNEIIEKGSYGLTFVVKWFWMDRGDDSYGDFDALIIFGSPFSNIVADQHFANAMFAGEPVIDFTTDGAFTHKDERMQKLKISRQENELMQGLFRLRPAKPREDPQDIVILSKMKLPIPYEMPGAVRKLHYGPDFDAEGIAKGMRKLWKRFGFWTDTMSAFIYDADALIEWFDKGGMESDLELPILYNELIFRMKRFVQNWHFRRARENLFGVALKLPIHLVPYRIKSVRVWGNPAGAEDFLEQLRLGTREPGCDDDDDEYVNPEDVDMKVDVEPPPEPGNHQVEQEAETTVDPDGIFTNDALELLSLLQQGGTGPPGGGV